MNQNLIVAAVQMTSHAGIDDNLKTASSLIDCAAEKGAQFVVLPEYFAMMDEPLKQAKAAREINEKTIPFLAAKSRECGMYLIGGGVPVPCEEPSIYEGINKSYNVSFIFGPDGNRIATYAKMHLFEADLANQEVYNETDIFSHGKEPLLLEINGFKIGFAICNDIRYPKLFIHYANRGVEALVVPAAFTRPTGEMHWEILTRTRAVETQSYLIASAQTGIHYTSRYTWGRSEIIDPLGKILEILPGGEGVIVSKLEKDKLAETRAMLPILNNKREISH